jgi:hypothetical protein
MRPLIILNKSDADLSQIPGSQGITYFDLERDLVVRGRPSDVKFPTSHPGGRVMGAPLYVIIGCGVLGGRNDDIIWMKRVVEVT